MYILVEEFSDIAFLIFILFIVFMFLSDHQLFDSPLYLAGAAVIAIGVCFWIYKSIKNLLRLNDG
jgi:hypothetical protein